MKKLRSPNCAESFGIRKRNRQRDRRGVSRR
jgi:hypothetical protein